jgi:hypothetical protein
VKPHRTDVISLTFGLIFLGIVVVWLFNVVLDLHVREPGWIGAGALILFGLIGLLGALRSDRRGGDDNAAVSPPGPEMNPEVSPEVGPEVGPEVSPVSKASGAPHDEP